MIKYLFLDIDGVLFTLGGCIYHRLHNSERMPHKELDPVALALLTRIVKEHEEIRVVISSTWRKSHDLENFKEYLGPIIGSRLVGKTPVLRGYRGEEISAWLKENAPTATADDVLILDDESDMRPFLGCLFRTDSHNGFSARNFCELKDYLKSSPQKRNWRRLKETGRQTLRRAYWRTYHFFKDIPWKIKRLLEKISK